MVAGLSSGAFMAVQVMFAYSSKYMGSGVIAGGPFDCAQGSTVTAEIACMSQPAQISVPALVKIAQQCAKDGKCDALDNLKAMKAWLFSGTGDTVVDQGVMKALKTMLGSFMPATSINATFNIDAEHSWPTNDYGNACSHLGTPYMNNCNLDTAREMTDFVFGGLSAPTAAKSSNMHKLDQTKFAPNGDVASISMGPSAYVYYGGNCASNPSSCRAILAFHGCQQSIADIGTDFVEKTGLNEMAEANDIIVLYPQAVHSYYSKSDVAEPQPMVSNPEGCWDWFGYTTTDYYNNKGPQMITTDKMFAYVRANGPSQL